MKVLAINSVPYGSTAKIMVGISKVLEENGFETINCTGYSSHSLKDLGTNYYLIGNVFDKFFHMCMSILFGNDGSYSLISTHRLCKFIKKEKPDIIHLHNVHCWYLNFKLFFKFLKRNNIKTIWTFHDCWPFTGHCTHYMLLGCDKWKESCKNCKQIHCYPRSLIDNSSFMYKKKKELFGGLDLSIVTPSKWLQTQVRLSFFKDKKSYVINNGINVDIFKYRESNFKSKYNIGDKKIILGVSFGWSNKKGLDVFIELEKKLSDQYKIVIVGTDSNVDKVLPSSILSIHCTQNQVELAEIYSAAEIFLNPTREDNYPTVNMEAIACGTPVLTFNTGGSPEIITPKTGKILYKQDLESLLDAIYSISKKAMFDDCINQGRKFDENERYKEYIELYKNVLQEG